MIELQDTGDDKPPLIYILDTPRVRLRAPHPNDLDLDQARCMSERAKFDIIHERPDLCEGILYHRLGQWLEYGFGPLAIDDQATGDYLGCILLNRFDLNGETAWAIGWYLFDGAEGRGIGYEAATTALAWYQKTCGLTDTLYTRPDPQNHRSVALTKRLGAKLIGEYEHDHYGTLELWKHPA